VKHSHQIYLRDLIRYNPGILNFKKSPKPKTNFLGLKVRISLKTHLTLQFSGPPKKHLI